MTTPGPTQEEYDSLINKLATLESELGQARKLLEAPAKAGWWKRLWGGAVVVALVMVFIGTVAWGKVDAFFTGNDYLQQNNILQTGYVTGVVDAFHLAASMQGQPKKRGELTKFVNYSKPMSNHQIKAVVDKFMKAHPEQWHLVMADLVCAAVTGSK
jgi:hypothetical protein